MPAGFDARDQVVVGLVLDPFPDPKKEDPLVTRFLRGGGNGRTTGRGERKIILLIRRAKIGGGRVGVIRLHVISHVISRLAGFLPRHASVWENQRAGSGYGTRSLR